MNTQLRRWVSVGLITGSLAISALVGAGAVGAADADRGELTTRSAPLAVQEVGVAPRNVTTQSVIAFGAFDGREDNR